MKRALHLAAVVAIGLSLLTGATPVPTGTPTGAGIELTTTQLVAGSRDIHIRVLLSDAILAASTNQREVTVFAVHAETGKQWHAVALKDTRAPGLYLAKLALTVDGAWNVRAEVADNGIKLVSEQTLVEVAAQGGRAGGSVVFALVVLAVAGGATYIWWSSRRRSQGKA